MIPRMPAPPRRHPAALLRMALASPCAVLLAACTASSTLPSPPTVAADEARDLSRTERLAQDLVDADAAFAAGDTASLAPLVERIAVLEPEWLEKDTPSPLREWRVLVPDTAPPMRGRALGPGYMRGQVPGGARRVTEQLLLSGEIAHIALGSAPRGGLALRVRDADGKLACEHDPAHARDCRFVPIFTQRYRIEIENTGEAVARYYLVVD